MRTTKTVIKCSKCQEEFEYEDDGISFQCMPDGVVMGKDSWWCSDCMVCECGCSCIPDDCNCSEDCKSNQCYKNGIGRGG